MVPDTNSEIAKTPFSLPTDTWMDGQTDTSYLIVPFCVPFKTGWDKKAKDKLSKKS